MNYDLISFEVEQQIKNEIKELFEIKIIEKIISDGKIVEVNNYFKMMQEGYSFKVSEDLAPKIFNLCHEVKSKLEFNDDIDFFITSSSSVNAFAVPKLYESDSNIIVITSELMDRFEEDELRFVIGHEIGHLISDYARISRVINFIYPSLDQLPIIIQNKINFWNKLAELTADRFGYIASPNLDMVISNFFKLASGLNSNKISFNASAYLAEINDLIDSYQSNPLSFPSTHPINPIRIKALELFSKSKLFEDINNNVEASNDLKLEEEIKELSSLLTVLTNSELDQHRLYFLASGGLKVALADDKLDSLELEAIYKILGNFHMFPHDFLDAIAQSGQMENIFTKSIQNILELNPGERYPMLDYLIDIILRDKNIEKEEIAIIYKIGQENLGISKKEVAQRLGLALQKGYVPNILNKN